MRPRVPLAGALRILARKRRLAPAARSSRSIRLRMASVISAVIDWFRSAAWTLNRRSRGSGRLNVTFR